MSLHLDLQHGRAAWLATCFAGALLLAVVANPYQLQGTVRAAALIEEGKARLGACGEACAMEKRGVKGRSLESSDKRQFPEFPNGAQCSSIEQPLSADSSTEHEQTDNFFALEESDGYFNESSSHWKQRKHKHIHQMCLQGQLMNSCVKTWFSQNCHPGCTGGIDGTAPSKSSQRFTNFHPLKGCLGKEFYQAHYEPSFICDFDRRLGLQGEGGKWVCDPPKLRNAKSCLVYTIGSGGKFNFERSVHDEISPHCEIHVIDANNFAGHKRAGPPHHVQYHKYSVGVPPGGTPVSTIVKDLGHDGRSIDIFKIECDGCEWDTYRSWFGSGVNIRQIQVRLHEVNTQTHAFFKHLFDLGYVVFHKESAIYPCGPHCADYSFLRLSPKFSRASSF